MLDTMVLWAGVDEEQGVDEDWLCTLVLWTVGTAGVELAVLETTVL